MSDVKCIVQSLHFLYVKVIIKIYIEIKTSLKMLFDLPLAYHISEIATLSLIDADVKKSWLSKISQQKYDVNQLSWNAKKLWHGWKFKPGITETWNLITRHTRD